MARARGRAGGSKMLKMAYSFFFACMVYIFFSIYMMDTRTVRIPITIRSSQTLVNNSNLPEAVDVVIRGDKDVIYGINADKIKAKLNFSAVEMEGIYILPVEIEYDLGILDDAKIEIYPVRKNVRVSMVKRPNSPVL